MEIQANKRVRVGDLLIDLGLITSEQLSLALNEQKEKGIRLGQAVVDLGLVTEDQLLQALADHFNYPYVDLSIFKLDVNQVSVLTEMQARRYKAIVLAPEKNGVLVGMADPNDLMVLDEISRIVKKTVYPAFVKESDLFAALDTAYRRTNEMASIAGELEGELKESDFDINEMAMSSDTSEAPVVRLLQSLFEEAVSIKASDIHIEPEESLLRIRLRVDGGLQEQVMNEHRVAAALVSRLKIMSGLDISEKRIPQDGRFNIRVNKKSIDVRLSTMPVPYGETVVMRLLDQSNAMLNTQSLGMPDDLRERFEFQVQRPHGIVLVTGPTGSGKTTTLYSALNLMNTADKKIITAEDPIEYRLPRINQVQINTKVGLDFSTVLRAALRQDPDVILIGEMRDAETAEIGLRAAMTGHLVLSTLHTNDAVSTAMRLLDMGVDHFLVASSLRAVLAQRLVKKVCTHCSTDYELSEQDKIWLERMDPGSEHIIYKHGRGCHRCHNTGYQGRIGVYELLEMDEHLLSSLRSKDAEGFSLAAKNSATYRRLGLCALDYAKSGVTSVQEVFRVTADLEA